MVALAKKALCGGLPYCRHRNATVLAARFHVIQLLASEWEDAVAGDSGDSRAPALHAATETAFGEGSWDSG